VKDFHFNVHVLSVIDKDIPSLFWVKEKQKQEN